MSWKLSRMPSRVFRIVHAPTLLLALCCWLGGLGAAVAAPPAAAPNPAEDIRDIHGPIALAYHRPVGWMVAGAAALVAAGVGISLYARRRRPRLPAHERALRALGAVSAAPGADARAFSFAVSEIVRAYIEEIFPLRAAHRTTEELLADLMQDQSPIAAHRAELGQFLHHCDLAKFAGWSLSPADMTAMLVSAEALVRATTNVPASAATGQPARAAAIRGEGIA